MRKSFYTLSLTKENFDLAKDPGMIPYYLHKLGYQSHFVSFIKPDTTNVYQQLVEGVKLHYLGDQALPKLPQLMMCCRKALSFIFKYRKDIDILNLYYLKHSIIYGLFYKIVHPKGILYVKLDMNVSAFEREARQTFHFIRRFVYWVYLHLIVDKVSVESTAGYKALQKQFHLSPTKILYLPNGIDDRHLDKVLPVDYSQKKNLIITVGRIGAYEKNTEMLLEACKSVRWKDDWELHIIGPISEGFKEKIDVFYKETSLEERVKFVGPIIDKEALFGYYNIAKVFCLTSRFESFGFVCIEAQAYGNILLSTPISSIDDFILDDSMGRKIETAEQLSSQLNHLMESPKDLEKPYSKIITHAQQFRWSSVCDKLSKFLQL